MTTRPTAPVRLRRALLAACACGLALALPPRVAAQGCERTERISLGPGGVQGDGHSTRPLLSRDGRYLAFTSAASNLVPGDTNAAGDVFVHDRLLGQIERVSVGSSGEQGNGGSQAAAISADGRWVLFSSNAANLVVGDTNGVMDSFLRDRIHGQTLRVSLGTGGIQANRACTAVGISGNGRVVGFYSNSTNLAPGIHGTLYQVFVRDLDSGETRCISVNASGTAGNHHSFGPVLSDDGRFGAFEGLASNLVPGDTFNRADVFVFDLATDVLERVSISTSGLQGNGDSSAPAFSGDGRYVAFHSMAYNLVPGDGAVFLDVFVRDRLAGTTERVSESTAGILGNGDSWLPSISADGRFVSFSSMATNLVPGGTVSPFNIYVHDRSSRRTDRLSVAYAGGPASNDSILPSISADGMLVAFESNANNLVPGDTNNRADVFLLDRRCPFGATYCFGDGSGTSCPCANPGQAGEGCRNSTGTGGKLVAGGSSSVLADDLTLTASQLLPLQPAYLFRGLSATGGGSGARFGDGLRCAGIEVTRFGLAIPSAGGVAIWGPGLAASGGWTSGDLFNFQCFYRDQGGPCGSGFNLTNGVEILMEP